MKSSLNAKLRVNDRILILIYLSVQCAVLIGQLPLYYFDTAGYSGAHIQDLKIYYEYSLNFINGGIPYLGFNMEYPPLSLVAFSLPHLFSFMMDIGFYEYIGLFVLENVFFNLISFFIIIYIALHLRPKNRSAITLIRVYTLAVVFCSLILPWRYDMFPALLTILAFLCIRTDKPISAGFFLGVATLAKLYPILLLVVFGIYYFNGKNVRALVGLITGATAAALVLIPLFMLDPVWIHKFIGYHLQRGIQLESLYSGLFLLADTIGIAEVKVLLNYGAVHISSTYSEIVLKMVPYISVAILAVVIISCFIRFRQEREDKGSINDDSLIAYMVMIILAFIIANKVLSPQYIIWLLPFIPLLRPRQAGLMLGICFLTGLIYPIMYRDLMALRYTGVILLNLRNLLLVVLFLWLLKENMPVFRRKSAIRHASK